MSGQMRFLFLGVALICLCGIAAIPAHASVIVNGSFENGDFGGFPAWRRLPSGSTFLDGWQIGGVAVDWHNPVDLQVPHTGDKVVDLHLDGVAGQMGTIGQAFATTPGQAYQLKFFLAGPGVQFGFPNPRSVLVDVAGVQVVFSSPASSHLNMVWYEHQLSFTAVAASTTLTFSSMDNGVGFWGPVLDDVTVEAVPEPATSGLCLTALAGIALFATRRNRRS